MVAVSGTSSLGKAVTASTPTELFIEHPFDLLIRILSIPFESRPPPLTRECLPTKLCPNTSQVLREAPYLYILHAYIPSGGDDVMQNDREGGDARSEPCDDQEWSATRV